MQFKINKATIFGIDFCVQFHFLLKLRLLKLRSIGKLNSSCPIPLT